MIIYVGGVSGTGKTLLIKQTLDRLEKEGIKIELTRGLELLCKLVGVKTLKNLDLCQKKQRLNSVRKCINRCIK